MSKRIKLKITRLGNDGEGIAYYNKKPVFIDYGLIGETVEVDLITNSRGNYEGVNLKVIKESPLRIKPPCQYYFECGGCNMQHLPYFETIKHKRNVLNFLFNVRLRKETKNTKLNLTILSPDEFRYRNKVTLPVQTANGKIRIGLFYKDTNRFLPIDTCLVHKLNIDLIIQNIINLLEKHEITPFDPKSKQGFLRYLVIRTNQKGEFQITFILYKDINLDELVKELDSNNPKVFSLFKLINDDLRTRDFFKGDLILLKGDYYLVDEIGDKKFLLGPDSFFQLNSKQAKNMYDEMIRMANFTKDDIILDGYAGVATIGIYLSDLAKEVHSIEINEGAVKAALEAVKLNNANNVSIYKGDTLEVAKNLDVKPNVVIFNPPRTGLGLELTNYLLKTKPSKIIYGSCNPKTLVDDLKILSTKYDIIETTPLDMFPQTGHIESVTLLKLKNYKF